MVDYKIENVIAETEFGVNLDLDNIANAVDVANYDPDQFPGLIYKLRSPKTISLLFSHGHCVCSGATSISNAKAALKIIYKKLKDRNLIKLDSIPKIIIKDIVISYDYGSKLVLPVIAKKLPTTETEYNPREFPGLVYHDKDTDINVLIFSSGVIIGYGAPFIDHLDELLSDLEQHYS
jgi:transcription initiation factor TFIID TATA-box-binding protein